MYSRQFPGHPDPILSVSLSLYLSLYIYSVLYKKLCEVDTVITLHTVNAYTVFTYPHTYGYYVATVIR